MRSRIYLISFIALLIGLSQVSGCASRPTFDDSRCTPYGGYGSCPTSYNAQNDSFPYVQLTNTLDTMTLEQRLDYLGSIHKALMNPEAYHTHRAVLLSHGEWQVINSMVRKDGAYTALATLALTFGRDHHGEPFLDAAAAMLQNDPALLAAIQSRVPVVTGYDALDFNSRDTYVMVRLFRQLYADVERAAQNGDPRSCELVAPVDVMSNDNFLLRDIRFNSNLKYGALITACSKASIPSQSMYQHKVYLNSIWFSAYHDEARIAQHKQAWVNKAVALANRCTNYGINLNQIRYDKYSLNSVSKDMQAPNDETYRDGMDETAYRETAAERRYLWNESDLYYNGAIVSPMLTPYLFIAAVAHSCG